MTEEVSIRITADTRQAKDNIAGLRKEVKGAGKESQAMQSGFGMLGRNLGMLSPTIGKLGKGFGQLGKQFKDLGVQFGSNGVFSKMTASVGKLANSKLFKIGLGVTAVGAIGSQLLGALGLGGAGSKLAPFDKINAVGGISILSEILTTLLELIGIRKILEDIFNWLKSFFKKEEEKPKDPPSSTPSTPTPAAIPPVSNTGAAVPSAVISDDIEKAVKDVLGDFNGIRSPFPINTGATNNTVSGQLNQLLGAQKNVVNGAVSTHLSNMIQGAAETLAGASVATKVTSALGNIGKGIVDTLGSVGKGIVEGASSLFNGFKNLIGWNATGGVYRPNAPTLIGIGDNTTQPEIVAPYDMIVNAVRDALSASNGGTAGTKYERIEVVTNLDGRTVARTIYDPLKAEERRRNGVGGI